MVALVRENAAGILRSRSAHLLSFGLGLLALLSLAACAPQIGDDCRTSINCSINGDRFCDRAQLDGYCTVRGCDPDTCPDDALCIEWRFEPPRGTDSYCMKSCSRDRDCRDGYWCVLPEDVDELWAFVPGTPPGTPIARLLDLEEASQGRGFCASLEESFE